MAWIQCPACMLKHTARPDGRCPKCRFPLAPPSAGAPAPTPGATAPVPTTTVAPSADWDRPRSPAAAGPLAAPRPRATPGPYAAAAWAAPRELTVGSLFTGTFSAWFGTGGAVLPLLTLSALPAAYAAYRLIRTMSFGGPDPSAFLWLMGILFFLGPPQMVLSVRAAMRHAARAPVEIGDLLGEAWRTYLPVLVISVILALAWGSMSMVNRMFPRVPGAAIVLLPAQLYLLTVWTVSVPALVAEPIGPIAALGRSWELTRGRRWRILGAFVLIGLCAAVVALGVYVGLSWSLVKAYGPVRRSGDSRSFIAWMMAVYVVILTLVGSVLSAATGVAYHQLRGQAGEDEDLRRVFA